MAAILNFNQKTKMSYAIYHRTISTCLHSEYGIEIMFLSKFISI